MTKTMGKKPRKQRAAPSAKRILVQALVEPDLKAWVEKMAEARDLKVGPYLRVLLAWAREQEQHITAGAK